MQTMLLKAVMALGTLLSSHQAAIATIDFLFDRRTKSVANAREVRHMLYRVTERLQKYIDDDSDDKYVAFEIAQAQALIDICCDARKTLDQTINSPNIPYQAPYPGMLPHAHPSNDGNPTHHEDIHSSIAATWRDIRSNLEEM
jgi:hypothetical protein